MKETSTIYAVAREPSAPLAIEHGTIDRPSGSRVLVRLHGTGICHTDLSVRDGHLPYPLPAVLGHEGAGVIEAVGEDVRNLEAGDHVVLSFDSCGECVNCRNDKPAYCREFYACNFSGGNSDGDELRDADGCVLTGRFFGQSSFASYALASARSAVKVDRDIPLHLLGPLGCGVQTGAGAVLKSLAVESGSSIAIFGAGSVGLSALLAAKLVGCETIIVIDPLASRRALAMELGATVTIDPDAEDPVDRIRELCSGGADYSLECTGRPEVLRQAFEALAVPGVCGAIGAAPFGAEVSLDVNSIIAGRTIRGIVEGDSMPEELIPELISHWREGRFPFDKLIETYPLSEINRAIDDMKTGRVLKPVLIPDGLETESAA